MEGMRTTDHTRCKGKFDRFAKGELNDISSGKKILSGGSTTENLEKDGDRRGDKAGTVDSIQKTGLKIQLIS